MHYAAFGKTRIQAARALMVIKYIGGLRGTEIFTAGKLVESTYITTRTIECFLEACGCTDRRAHCERTVDYRPFPCRLLLRSGFVFDYNHPSSQRDQIQAAGVHAGCNWCPNFDPDRYEEAGRVIEE